MAHGQGGVNGVETVQNPSKRVDTPFAGIGVAFALHILLKHLRVEQMFVKKFNETMFDFPEFSY